MVWDFIFILLQVEKMIQKRIKSYFYPRTNRDVGEMMMSEVSKNPFHSCIFVTYKLLLTWQLESVALSQGCCC